MKAIVLAAGKGERLYPLTRNMPKSLIHIGNGITILESQVNVFAECGISELYYVCGYKVEQIEARIKGLGLKNIKIIYNPFFDISNNLVSAWMARNEMANDFILVNGDNIFKPRVVQTLLMSNKPISMVISKKDNYDEEDMKVICKDDTVVIIGKDVPMDKASGESIGMIRFSGLGVDKFRMKLDEMVREKDDHSKFYLAAIQNIINDGFGVHYSECLSEDWAEIDFHPDIQLLKDRISNYQSIIE